MALQLSALNVEDCVRSAAVNSKQRHFEKKNGKKGPWLFNRNDNTFIDINSLQRQVHEPTSNYAH